MRLDKLLANMGFGSRKDVKAIIKKGHVTVNDEIIKDNAQKIDPYSDVVIVNGEKIHYQKYVYIMMNKPPGYISATEDLYEKTVIDLLPGKFKIFNPFPVGRLDKDTVGLLLLTNDGQLAHQLTSPKKGIEKTYYAKVNGFVTTEDQKAFKHGIMLDDGYQTLPAKLNILKSDHVSEVELTITEGKFHQVKRMFSSLGKKVVYLKRIKMGNLTLDQSLPLGGFRELTENELAYCQSLTKKFTSFN